ncbi:MAG: hypothetical protein M3R07_09775 [Gemmatimonadota bacterium]|nr:hypothetical protein [Gemmatimonadota bacterium]
MTVAQRPGFVLPAALACVILIAVIATAALFASGQEAAATRAAILEQQATGYAERSARQTIDSWNCPGCDSLPVGGVIVKSHAADHPLESTVYTTRLDSALFLVVAEGRVVASGATRLARRIAIAVRTSRDSLAHSRAVPLFPQSWTPIYRM